MARSRTFRNVDRAPVDLAGGRQLAPGADADIDPTDDQNAVHIEAGRLREVGAASRETPTPTRKSSSASSDEPGEEG